MSFILLEEDEEFLVLDHQEQTVMRFGLPIDPNSHLSEEDARILEHNVELLTPKIEIRKLDEVGTIDHWTAYRYSLDVRLPNGQILYAGDFWLSQDLPKELIQYEELMKTLSSFSQISRLWKYRILDLDGVIVQRTKTADQGGATVITTETLKAVREVESDDRRYEVPDGYELIEVDPRVFGHVTPGLHLLPGDSHQQPH